MFLSKYIENQNEGLNKKWIGITLCCLLIYLLQLIISTYLSCFEIVEVLTVSNKIFLSFFSLLFCSAGFLLMLVISLPCFH